MNALVTSGRENASGGTSHWHGVGCSHVVHRHGVGCSHVVHRHGVGGSHVVHRHGIGSRNEGGARSGRNSSHVLSVACISAGVLCANGVRDGVLLSDAPGFLPVPLCLGQVALALILESLCLAACCLVALEGGGNASLSNRANGSGSLGGSEGLSQLGGSLLAVADSL
jgi:hypothetical protein